MYKRLHHNRAVEFDSMWNYYLHHRSRISTRISSILFYSIIHVHVIEDWHFVNVYSLIDEHNSSINPFIHSCCALPDSLLDGDVSSPSSSSSSSSSPFCSSSESFLIFFQIDQREKSIELLLGMRNLYFEKIQICLIFISE